MRIGWSNYSIVTIHMYACLLYGFEACPINSSDYTSLEHPITMAFMKIFKTNSVTVVNEYQEAFGFNRVRRQIMKRKLIF